MPLGNFFIGLESKSAYSWKVLSLSHFGEKGLTSAFLFRGSPQDQQPSIVASTYIEPTGPTPQVTNKNSGIPDKEAEARPVEWYVLSFQTLLLLMCYLNAYSNIKSVRRCVSYTWFVMACSLSLFPLFPISGQYHLKWGSVSTQFHVKCIFAMIIERALSEHDHWQILKAHWMLIFGS